MSAVQEWQAGVGREALVKMIILNPRLLVFSYKQHVDLQAWFAKLGVTAKMDHFVNLI